MSSSGVLAVPFRVNIGDHLSQTLGQFVENTSGMSRSLGNLTPTLRLGEKHRPNLKLLGEFDRVEHPALVQELGQDLKGYVGGYVLATNFFGHAFLFGSGSLDQGTDQPQELLVLGTSRTRPEKGPDLNVRHAAA